MRTTQEGIELIKSFEGCSLTAYQDQGGLWTIGWGCRHGVNQGDKWTQEWANFKLLQDITFMESLVLNCIPGVRLNNNELSALVSFAYNVGLGRVGVKSGFKVLKTGEPSTLLECLLSNSFDLAADEFPKWDKVGGVPNAGILRRRMAERALFLKPEVDHGTD